LPDSPAHIHSTSKPTSKHASHHALASPPWP